MNVTLEHRLAPGVVRVRIALVLLCGLALSELAANAQTPSPQQTRDSMAMGETHPTAPPTALRDLVDEAEKNNPELAASFHAWKAGTYVPKQASALPETELTVQQFAVGSQDPSRDSRIATLPISVSAPHKSFPIQANVVCVHS
jgi:hypothetical protein